MAHAKTNPRNEDYDKLRADFEILRGDMLTLARELRAYARHEEQTLTGKAGERVVALKSSGEHQLEMAKGYALDAAKSAEETVREHPAYAVAGAAALGFLLGAFTVRRR